MNPRLDRLQPYPFERLAELLAGAVPPADVAPISLGVGEPQHPAPDCARQAIIDHLDGFSRYPATRGEAGLREAIADWLTRRFGLDRCPPDPDTQILPVAGTREALFAFAQAVVASPNARVALPNPGYQIYEGAALLAGAEPLYLPCRADNGFRPDLDAVTPAQWRQCELVYLCSPGNPTGAVLDADYLARALALAERHDFILAADECYSEIYLDEQAPPPGLLEVAAGQGNDRFQRCVVFHSLSKRSNLPGLRSGFVAGDAEVLRQFLRYRTYHGATLGPPVQAASRAAWSDEAHVLANRDAYRAKFDAVLPILAPMLDVARPAGSFYLWPALPDAVAGGDDETFVRALFEQQHLRAVPGRYLGRDAGGGNLGNGRLRLSLVAGVPECVEAAHRIVRVAERLGA